MSAMAMSNDDNQWELCKENVIPIKRGRSTKGLQDTLSKAPQQHEDQDARIEKGFEDELKGQVDVPLAQLETYMKYFKWVRDRFPTNNDKALKLVERCTYELKDHAVLKNEPRFVKMWIEYADMVKTPGEVFSFMQSNKIGEKVSLFWIAWAFVAEKFDNFKLADQIFQKAMRRQAEPKDILQKRYQQFQRRMARHFLNKMEDASQTDATDAPPSRVALQTVSGPSSTRNALTSGQSGTNMQTSQLSQAIPSSKAKAGSQGHLASNGTPGFSLFEDPAVATRTEDPALIENKGWKSLGKDSDRRKENEAIVTKWNEGPLQNPASLGHDPRLVSQRALPTTAPVLLSTPAIPIFVDEDLQDLATSTHGENQSTSAESVAVYGNNVRRALDAPGQATLRKHTTLSEIEKISQDPLARHKGVVTLAPETVVEPKQEPSESRKASFVAPKLAYGVKEPVHSNDGATDQTRFAVFADNQMTSHAPVVPVKKFPNSIPAQGIAEVVSNSNTSIQAVPFSIFVEGSDEGYSVPSETSTKPTTPSSGGSSLKHQSRVMSPAVCRVTKTMQQQKDCGGVKPSTTFGNFTKSMNGSAPFDIFSEESVPSETKGHTAGKQIAEFPSNRKLASSLAATKPAKALPPTSSMTNKFKVYQSPEQTSEMMPKQELESKVALSVKPRSVATSQIGFSTPGCSFSPRTDVQEAELDKILAEMGVLDDEDGTINTRLAKRDIDSMFCSPGSSVIPSGTTQPNASETQISSTSFQSLNNDVVSSKKRRAKYDDPQSNSPKVLTLRSYAGGIIPSGAPRAFGGSDLSAIQEVSGEYSVFGNLHTSPAPSQPWLGVSTMKKAPGNTRSSLSDGFSIFCDKIESPQVGHTSSNIRRSMASQV